MTGQNPNDMIFYLSGTGNTRWAASEIALNTGESLVDITKADGQHTAYSLADGERIGFCFPVHGWRPPKIYRKFIHNLDVKNAQAHYCYALCTAGDDIGETVKILRDDLAARGIRLNSAFSLIMPESYVGLPFMDVDTPENEARKKEKAAADLARHIKAIAERKKGIEELATSKWPRINSRLLGGVFARCLVTDKPFRVTADKCIGCGTCAATCPTGNIIMDGNTPHWQRNRQCMACFSCYHHCPTHAIEYGRMTKHKGQYYFK